MLNIEPICLLSGSHADTGSTGSGCFMNVIAYLNGEPQITDRSPCVCPTIRPIAIWLNDYMRDNERHRLLPFVMRAMGTATGDGTVLQARMVELVWFARDMAVVANRHADAANAAAKRAGWAAANAAAKRAEWAAAAANAAAKRAERAAADAAKLAKRAEWAADADAAEQGQRAAAAVAAAAAAAAAAKRAKQAKRAEWARSEIIERCLAFMEAVCLPLSEPSVDVIQRAQSLMALAAQE